MPEEKKSEKTTRKIKKKLIVEHAEAISNFDFPSPYDVLGAHRLKNGSLAVSAYIPFAENPYIIEKTGNKEKHQLERVGTTDVYMKIFKDRKKKFPYLLEFETGDGNITRGEDPYRFNPGVITDYDIHLMGEGSHYKLYDKLGARSLTIDGVKGTHFAVWAPNAKAVSLAGEFNDWTPGLFPMQNLNGSGIWVLFFPGLREGHLYKYAIKSSLDGEVKFKVDPLAFQTEHRPGSASVTTSLENFNWTDKKWLDNRAQTDFKSEPISIYEIHPGSWKRNFNNPDFPNEWGFISYRQLANEIVDYVKDMGYTHIELLPVMEHPLDTSWGYQVVNYFAPTSRFGTPEDFMYFVNYCHKKGLGVILDWVPGHFPTDAHGLFEFDGTQTYAYTDSKKGFHKDWGTCVFDFGRNEVRNFLISNALFWFDKYHIDGIRVDAVASILYLDYSREDGEWEPNIHGGRENIEAVEFIKMLNDKVHELNKGTLMIAEESTSWPGVTKPVYLGGLGFDMKWNMGWMHDVLHYFSLDPIHRKYSHNKITFSLWYSFDENFLLPISHDEVVHGKKSLLEKMPGTLEEKFSNLRLFLGFMFAHPGKKLNFMCNDIAQYNEWNCESQTDWEVLDNAGNRQLNTYFKELNHLYKSHSPFYEVDFTSDGFKWIDFSDSENSVLSFARYNKDKKNLLLFTFNMTPVKREEYVLGVPKRGFYKEIFNSDAVKFGGSGEGNLGGVHSVDEQRYEWEQLIKVTLPPLAMNVFTFESDNADGEGKEEEVEVFEPVEPVQKGTSENETLENTSLEDIERTVTNNPDS